LNGFGIVLYVGVDTRDILLGIWTVRGVVVAGIVVAHRTVDATIPHPLQNIVNILRSVRQQLTWFLWQQLIDALA